jgi:predicted alpha/beta superfamily hydrolase
MDRMKRIFVLVATIWLHVAIQAQLPAVSSGQLIRIDNFSSDFVAPRNVDIWLPPGYNEGRRYPVLYMHDGQMLFDSTVTWNKQEWGLDEVMANLLQQNQIEPCIVVGISNLPDKRRLEYAPQKAVQYLSEADWDILREEPLVGKTLAADSLQADNYLRFIVEELKPAIDKKYATNPNREHTMIAGSSFGGLISMYAICEYPEVFGSAACLSIHWTGLFRIENNPLPAAFLQYFSEHIPDPNTHRLYFDHGTSTLDSMYTTFQQEADAIIRHAGYTRQNWMTLVVQGSTAHRVGLA